MTVPTKMHFKDSKDFQRWCIKPPHLDWITVSWMNSSRIANTYNSRPFLSGKQQLTPWTVAWKNPYKTVLHYHFELSTQKVVFYWNIAYFTLFSTQRQSLKFHAHTGETMAKITPIIKNKRESPNLWMFFKIALRTISRLLWLDMLTFLLVSHTAKLQWWNPRQHHFECSKRAFVNYIVVGPVGV